MDWNELIRIWGAGHPGEELRVEAAARDARRARERRRARIARRIEEPVADARRHKDRPGLGPREAEAHP
jgi:hypothetical protein